MGWICHGNLRGTPLTKKKGLFKELLRVHGRYCNDPLIRPGHWGGYLSFIPKSLNYFHSFAEKSTDFQVDFGCIFLRYRALSPAFNERIGPKSPASTTSRRNGMDVSGWPPKNYQKFNQESQPCRNAFDFFVHHGLAMGFVSPWNFWGTSVVFFFPRGNKGNDSNDPW